MANVDCDFSDIDECERDFYLGFNENGNSSDISVESYDSDDDVPLAELRQMRQNSESSTENEVGGVMEWSVDFQPITVTEFRGNPGPVVVMDDTKTEMDFFNLIFTEDLIKKCTEETNKYAAKAQLVRPDGKWRNVSYKEMRAYFGFQIVMGIVVAPNLDMYWCSDPTFSPSDICERMTRDRYDRISRYFHVADTTNNPPRGQPGHDKLGHVRPILETVRKTMMNNYRPHKEVSVDEAMIGFTGRLGFKQYLPMKPTKRGIKVWVRADPYNGYVNDIQVYLGKENSNGDRGLGERVVTDLTRDIWNNGHHVYCDNFFTTVRLFEELQQHGTYACGTVRSNRQGLPDQIKNQKLKKQGECVMVQKGNMVASAWRDKKTVSILSTNFDPTKPNATV